MDFHQAQQAMLQQQQLQQQQQQQQLQQQLQQPQVQQQPPAQQTQQQQLPQQLSQQHQQMLQNQQQMQQINAMNQLKAKQQASGMFLKGKPFVKKGRQLTECTGIPVVIYDNYQIIKRVGDGAYGVVFKAMDRDKNNELVAIKKMSDAFRDPRDAKRILREIKLLKFCDHPNIIKLKDIVKPESVTGYRDIYLVLEFMEIDLDKTINSEQPLSPRLIQSLMWQLLNGIYYMHSADIIHRDIKPSNILLLKNCTLKLADMNLARKFDLDERITEYVVTRPYRAPEILLSSQSYSKPIDIWSAGCIFAEMMGRKTIFKGTSYLNQLDRIVAIIGKPDFDKLSYKVDDSLREYIGNFSDKQPENFYEIYKSHDKQAIDLLYKMLAFDPKERWTVDQCLHHPYFASFSKANLKACDVKFDWSFDEIAERNDVIQRAIYNEACAFHADEPDAPAEEIENHYKQQQQQMLAQQQQMMAQKQMQMMMQQKQQQAVAAAAAAAAANGVGIGGLANHQFGKNPAEFQMHIEKLMAQQQMQKQQMMAMTLGNAAGDGAAAMLNNRPIGGPPGAAAAINGPAAAAFGNLMNFRPNSMGNTLPMFPHFNGGVPAAAAASGGAGTAVGGAPQSSQLPTWQGQIPTGMPPNGMMQHMFMQNLNHMQHAAAASMPLQKNFGNPFAANPRNANMPPQQLNKSLALNGQLQGATATTGGETSNTNQNREEAKAEDSREENGKDQESDDKLKKGIEEVEKEKHEENLLLSKQVESNESLPVMEPIRVKMHTFGAAEISDFAPATRTLPKTDKENELRESNSHELRANEQE